MLYALLASLPWAAVVVYLIRNTRDLERERHEASCVERAEWTAERRDLLNRIQAPEASQKQAALEIPQRDPDDKPYVGWDNDEEWHEAQGVTSGAA